MWKMVDDEVRCLRKIKVRGRDGQERWLWIPPVLTLHVSNAFTTLQLIYSAKCDTWGIQHPATLEYPILKVGKGKRRKDVPDVLAAKVERKGMREKYAFLCDFHKRILKMLGAELTETVLKMFAAEMAKL